MALAKFWRMHGSQTLVVLAVFSLVGAGAYGQLSYDPDVEPYLPEALPEAASFELLLSEPAEGSYLYVASDGNGHQLGYITATEGQGYGGPMTVMVTWSLEGTILSVQVPEHHDTPAWYGKLFEKEFFSQYIGRQYSQPLMLDEDIDAASGATHSSTGVATGVQAGRQLVSEQLSDPYLAPEEPISFGTAEIMLLVGLGTVVGFRMLPALRKRHWLRYFTLLFGFIVLGVWLSSPLSLVNFAIWPVGFAPSWQSNLFLYILVFGLVALAIFFAKNFWCFWLCPFNAIQEGMHFVGGSRVRTITKRQLLLRNTRYVILWLVLLIVLIMRNPSLSVFEPWNTLFSFKGNAEQWLLLVVVLGVAMFIYDFWCHYLCPVGATMDIILKVRMWFVDGFGRLFAR